MDKKTIDKCVVFLEELCYNVSRQDQSKIGFVIEHLKFEKEYNRKKGKIKEIMIKKKGELNNEV